MDIRHAGGDVLAPLRAAVGGSGRMLPAFLVVGTKRGGSSSLYDWITRHPAVAPCRARKGTHYFDVNHRRGEQWFRSGFPRSRPGWQITGEASPYYMFHPLAPRWIAECVPHAKIIAILRDPAIRAWSHYQYERSRGREQLPFDEALDREDERLAGEEDRIRQDPSYISAAHRYHSYLHRGHYAQQLLRLGEHFPEQQVLVLQSETLFREPQRSLSRVWEFLELDDVSLPHLPVVKAGHHDPIPDAARLRLERYYEPFNEQLYALPWIDFRWPDRDGAA